MISRRELIGSVAAAIAISGCFVPGGPKSRDLDLDNIEVRRHNEKIVEISLETDFAVANWDPDDAFHDISIVGFTGQDDIVCRHSIKLGEELHSTIEQDITFRCPDLPEYLTTTIEDKSCDSTFFSVYRIAQSNSNYTSKYLGERQCDDSITMIPE